MSAPERVHSPDALPCAAEQPHVPGALARHREQIDRLDAAIVQLLDARAALAERVGRAKRAAGLPVVAPEREEEVLRRVLSYARGPMSAPALQRIWQVILETSRDAQRRVRA